MKEYFRKIFINLVIIISAIITTTGCEIFIGDDNNNFVNKMKIGELDLSMFDDSDGFPEMNTGFVAGDNVYISLQRLDQSAYFSPSNRSKIVAFDTETLTHKTTIDMTLRNAYNMDYHKGYIYAACAGNWSNQYFGLEKINLSTHNSEIITSENIVTDVEVISDNKGYFIQYKSWGNTALRSFDPSTGIIDEENVAEIGDSGDWNINDINYDNNGSIWLADGSENNNGVYIIRTSDNTITDGPISTNLWPQKIAFTKTHAAVTTAAYDFTSGALSIIPFNSPGKPANTLFPTISDITVNSDGDYFYRIERRDSDNVAKLTSSKKPKVLWQYMTMDENDIDENISSSNPYEIIFINNSKAILLRFNSSRAWIIDPSI